MNNFLERTKKLIVRQKILLLILLLASILRLSFLSQFPAGFTEDEASNGYDAYSLLLTGNDRHGNFFPLTLEGFSDRVDHRSPVYTYSAMPFIYVLGLNIFSTRLPAAVFGILTIIFLYVLVKELFHNQKIALLAAGLLAISPWHIFMSRLAQESSITPFYFVAGLYFLVKGTSGKLKYLITGSVLFGLLLYNYPATRLFFPLFILGYIFIFREKVLKFKKQFAVSFFILFIVVLPLIIHTLNNYEKVQGRFHQISVFNNQDNNVLSTIAKNYFKHFSLDFLFFRGGSIETGYYDYPIGFGLLYLAYFPFIVYGVYCLIRVRKKEHFVLLLWLVLFPVPASLTVLGYGNILRSITAIPLFEIIEAYGFFCYARNFKNTPFALKNFFVSGTLVILFLSNVTIFSITYFKGFYQHPYPVFHYGYREIMSYLDDLSKHKKINKIVFIGFDNQPYIWTLFFSKYDPALFQNNKPEIYYVGDWGRVYSFDKYQFLANESFYQEEEGTVFVAHAQELTKYQPRKYIYTPGGDVVFKVFYK